MELDDNVGVSVGSRFENDEDDEDDEDVASNGSVFGT